MNIGIIVQPNKKGQIVIPKKIRDALGIDENVLLKLVPYHEGFYLHPVKAVTPQTKDDRDAFLDILQKTRGSWAGDDWPESEKRRRKIELTASEGRRKAPW